ncbi:MAG: hypothetical protein JSW34_10420 [Candidatus Zixiibacteriota bacterium]|nr:MAG: hypothetical protein JSW34_10420 [candidate division Zixibacteria bacterium]
MSQRRLLRARSNRGISLIEVTVIIVAVAILMAAAMQSMTRSMKESRKRRTEREMETLQRAIAGDPNIMSVAGGIRSDFGYVGDVGAFPPDLNALWTNPGGYATWDGPYVSPGFAGDTADWNRDEWGEPYTYNGGLEIVSNGSGKTMRRGSSTDISDYLDNTVYGRVRDINDSVPGADYVDSVAIEIVIPDGTGGTATKAYQSDWQGEFVMDSISVGRHLVRAIYTPDADTLIRYVAVMPRHSSEQTVRFNFVSNYFSAGVGTDSMLTLVAGSQSVYGQGSDCNNVSFDVRNNTGQDVELTSIKLTWPSPTAYYPFVYWNITKVWDNSSPRNGSGDVAVFDSPQTLTNGSTVTIKIEGFRSTPTGSGGKVDMSLTEFEVLFSDSSIFNVAMGSCY